MKAKFKVGDKVKILDGSRLLNYRGTWNSFMQDHVGKVATISSYDKPLFGMGYGYHLNELDYIWDERGLELAEANPKDWKVIIIPDGDKTIGKLFEDGKLTTTVETKKHPKDEYSINEAIKSITARLVEKHDERKPNFKIGDIVELVEKDVNYVPIPVGTRGEVVSYSPSDLWDIGVDFKIPYGCYTHDLDMRIKTPTGRWYNSDKFKLVHRP